MSSWCDSGARDHRNGTILPQWRAVLNHDLTRPARFASPGRSGKSTVRPLTGVEVASTLNGALPKPGSRSDRHTASPAPPISPLKGMFDAAGKPDAKSRSALVLPCRYGQRIGGFLRPGEMPARPRSSSAVNSCSSLPECLPLPIPRLLRTGKRVEPCCSHYSHRCVSCSGDEVLAWAPANVRVHELHW